MRCIKKILCVPAQGRTPILSYLNNLYSRDIVDYRVASLSWNVVARRTSPVW